MAVADMPRRHGESRHCKKSPPETLGILAFDAAKTMRSLVSLYKSLTVKELIKLHMETMKSKGVTYLNSKDHVFLLHLACAERLEQLNLAATMVSRLGHKCSDFTLNNFDLVYYDLKRGIINLQKIRFRTRNVQKTVKRMEKLVFRTSNLYTAMEALDQLEASVKKVQRWKTMGHGHNNNNNIAPNIDYLNDKYAFQKKQVQHYKKVSLWNQTFDKSVGYMARIVCTVYARIYSVFGPFISGVASLRKKKIRIKTCSRFNGFEFEDSYCLLEHRELYRNNFLNIEHERENDQILNRISKSAPIPKTTKSGAIRYPSSPSAISGVSSVGSGSPEPLGFDADYGVVKVKNNRVYRMASPTTVGGSGLSLRYADVIIFAEQYLHAPEMIGEAARESLYEMLPARLKRKVEEKMKRHMLSEWEKVENGRLLAEGWRALVEELMGWLSPVAHDTVKWHQETNLEKFKFDMNPSILLLQTLHYSDLEKAEAAIVQVLVGLSCMYRYEKRRKNIGRKYT